MAKNVYQLKKEFLEKFKKDYMNIHPGDSGPGGNVPQESVFELACYAEDVLDYFDKAMLEIAKATADEMELERGKTKFPIYEGYTLDEISKKEIKKLQGLWDYAVKDQQAKREAWFKK